MTTWLAIDNPAGAALWSRVERGHAHRPVEAAAFLAYVESRVEREAPGVPDAPDVHDRLAAVHVEDLYLACACASGDREAIAMFESRVIARVEIALASMKVAPAERSDVMQMLREQMIVEGGITKYDGRGPLASWLKVCAARIARGRAERDRRFVSLDAGDNAIGNLAPGVPDPELEHLRARYGAAFQHAFAAAVGALPPRQRTLLRLSVVDGLGIDQIAAIYHVHRATAARRIQAAREELVTQTRTRMATELVLTPGELESVLRLIRSIADVTLRLLMPGKRPPEI
ncbi:MAG: transcriptional regulator [Deltaproteobacteria bacterium]|nr:transcriptional regulator [Deltaproteobacteria bacterium]MDQ3300821.1 transcriptional regulator [Myxococcota bacterium]